MISALQQQALLDCFEAARTAGHIWPAFAACEAMEESAWGTTELFQRANNVFGEKQRTPPIIYSTILLPTWEVIRGEKKNIVAAFVQYPDFAKCFADRMATLRRLAPEYPNYAAALAATTGEEYVRSVSASWSTDPQRAANVLEIYNAHGSLLV
jgi:flagellum-specific peptidoglycan hydrolase FlgJ